MARFNASEADNYGGQGGAGFFGLKNDMDVARVRFMYNTIDDVKGMSVHQIEIDGKKRYVDCLREYNDPVDVCPFCKDHKPVVVKLFIPIYDVEEDRVKLWERGKKFFNKISGLCARYNPLVATEFEIERHGKAGSTDTTYEIFPIDRSEELSMEDLPEISDDFYNYVLKKSADDMEYFLEEGEFPPEDDAPRRRNNGGRRGSRKNEEVDEDELPFESESRQSRRSESRQQTRRTPANGRHRSSEDAY